MTSQSFMEEGIAPDDRTRCQNEQLTERTPLLSVSGSFHNPFLSTSFTSRFSIPSGDNVEEDKAVDVDRLLLDLARANSISSAPIPDVDPPLRHAVSNESIPSSDLDDCREQLENSWGPAVAYNSTFIGISAKRFWPMFITIMIGYFVCAPISSMLISYTESLSRSHALTRLLWRRLTQPSLPISNPPTQPHGFPPFS